MLIIDGSYGEGGGQILRTALALSLVTGKPFRAEKIRAGREKPGLRRQHLTAAAAAAEVGRAAMEGNALGSQDLTFAPQGASAGDYHFDVGTAGSTTLVLQTILPPLLLAGGPSRIVLEGGTHNPFAPPFDFLARAFLPLVNRMGPRVRAILDRPGFFPEGGGKTRVEIEPCTALSPLEVLERGEVRRRKARAAVARLAPTIAERELRVVRQVLGWEKACLRQEEIADSRGPGNYVAIEIESEHVTEVFTAFGAKGLRAEKVATAAAEEAREYLTAGVPVGAHLADQLLLPFAIAGGGSFRTLAPTSHTLTNIEMVKLFLDVEIELTPQDGRACDISVRKKEGVPPCGP